MPQYQLFLLAVTFGQQPFAAQRGFEFIVNAADRMRPLPLDNRFESLDLRQHLFHPLVLVGIERGQFGVLPPQVDQRRLILPQRAVVEHFGQRLGVAPHRQLVPRLAHHAFLLRPRERLLELPQLVLLDAVLLGGKEKAAPLDVAAQVGFGVFELRPRAGKLAVQPVFGLLGCVPTQTQAARDELVDHGVGEPRRAARIGGIANNLQHAAGVGRAYPQTLHGRI